MYKLKTGTTVLITISYVNQFFPFFQKCLYIKRKEHRKRQQQRVLAAAI